MKPISKYLWSGKGYLRFGHKYFCAIRDGQQVIIDLTVCFGHHNEPDSKVACGMLNILGVVVTGPAKVVRWFKSRKKHVL